MEKSKAQQKITLAKKSSRVDELVKKLDISRVTLLQLERGVTKPENIKLYVARSLKTVLGIEYDDWFEIGVDEKC